MLDHSFHFFKHLFEVIRRLKSEGWNHCVELIILEGYTVRIGCHEFKVFNRKFLCLLKFINLLKCLEKHVVAPIDSNQRLFYMNIRYSLPQHEMDSASGSPRSLYPHPELFRLHKRARSSDTLRACLRIPSFDGAHHSPLQFSSELHARISFNPWLLSAHSGLWLESCTCRKGKWTSRRMTLPL